MRIYLVKCFTFFLLLFGCITQFNSDRVTKGIPERLAFGNRQSSYSLTENSEKLFLALWENQAAEQISGFSKSEAGKKVSIISDNDFGDLNERSGDLLFEVQYSEKIAQRISKVLNREANAKLVLQKKLNTPNTKEKEPIEKSEESISGILPSISFSSVMHPAFFHSGRYKKYPDPLKSMEPKASLILPFFSKKLRKYYSLTNNAPPFGEKQC